MTIENVVFNYFASWGAYGGAKWGYGVCYPIVLTWSGVSGQRKSGNGNGDEGIDTT